MNDPQNNTPKKLCLKEESSPGALYERGEREARTTPLIGEKVSLPCGPHGQQAVDRGE